MRNELNSPASATRSTMPKRSAMTCWRLAWRRLRRGALWPHAAGGGPRAAAGWWRVTHTAAGWTLRHTRDEPPHSTTGLDLLGDPARSGLPSTPTVQATAGTPPACRSRTCSRRRLGSQSPTGDRPYPYKKRQLEGSGRWRGSLPRTSLQCGQQPHHVVDVSLGTRSPGPLLGCEFAAGRSVLVGDPLQIGDETRIGPHQRDLIVRCTPATFSCWSSVCGAENSSDCDGMTLT